MTDDTRPFEDIANAQGWSVEERYDVLRRYVENQADEAALSEFAERAAADEKDADDDDRAPAFVAAARRLHTVEGECEIDDDAKVSISSDGGAYVQAWVWVDDDDLEEEG